MHRIVSVLSMGVLALWFLGCGTAAPREWIIRFAPGDVGLERNAARAGVEDDWERIGTRIVSGSVCPMDPPRGENDVPGPDERGFDLRQVVPRGHAPDGMDRVLAGGSYTVMAWAVDEHEALYAWSCLGVLSPGAGPIVSELRAVPVPIALRAEWRVSFDDAATEALADRVFLRAQPGPCPASPPMHRSDDRLVDSFPHTEALNLANAEPTAFMAWAENDAGCSLPAFGCVEGPGPLLIDTVIAPLTPAPPFCSDPRACRATEVGLACDHLVIEEAALGNTSACFRSTEGEVFCEGSVAGAPMELPSGFFPTRLFARHARRASTAGALDRGDGYCALDAERTLVCWGDAFPFTGEAEFATAPHVIARSALPGGPGLPLVLSMGLRVGCVVMATDASGGSVYCRGLTGDPSREVLVGSSGPGPWELAPAPFGVGNDISILAAGAMATCASNGDRTYCWGDDRAAVATPDYAMAQHLQFIDGHRFEVVGAGEMHACGLANDGMVQCWGSDFCGQLEPRFEVRTLPPACAGLDYYAMVERPDCAGYALHNLYDGAHGPHSLRSSYDEAFSSDFAYPPLSPPSACTRSQDVGRESYLDCVLEVDGAPLVVSDLAVGAFHTCAISANAAPLHPDDAPGRVLCWGDDYADQIGGLGPDAGYMTHGNAAWVRPCAGDRPSPTSIVDDIVDIEAGTNGTCTIDARGDVLCWGSGVTCAVRPTGLPLLR